MSGRYPTLLLVAQLKEELERIFEEALQLGDGVPETAGWRPQVDVVEAADTVTLLAELPGVEAADLEIEAVGNVITLRGRKSEAADTPGGARFHRVERSHGPFERQIRIEPAVNSRQGRARLADGLLSIEFPKVGNQRLTPFRLEVEEVDASRNDE